MLDNQTTKTTTDKLKQKLAKDINTTNSCQNTTGSSVNATNGSRLYLLNDNEAK